MFTVEADPAFDQPVPDGRSREFRALFGRFATGVAVITTEHRGRRFAATANSLTSVSLEPLIVLVCFGRTSDTRKAVVESGRFGVAILDCARGESLSRQFAGKAASGADKLAEVDTMMDEHGIAVLADHCAYLTCEVHRTLPMGDHDVVFGRVLSFGGPSDDVRPEPLLFFGGRYFRLGPTTADDGRSAPAAITR